ncbi:hypothetical protein AWH56_019080 [Anaerobacillus isosaccharinicus]|uniref:Uncharacterized protein n=1 Tax=Anaerobacillus isosaccharinicus TaxID=1532552 RepID=A0A7S7RAF4_9BACI|nr:hypothetical protein [Anaerobacillus isosaccharinicus]MBA5586992.1 hypothetical protein [Anaerobacillus isosaccharinicus]QOY34805.1 hypothetical protein AWH56_019080 [Anaerobacillus isosaccharinicus]
MDMNYEQMTTGEIIAYYKRVKDYIDQGFRVEGLKDELTLISRTLQTKSSELSGNELEQYLVEIETYLKNIRH